MFRPSDLFDLQQTEHARLFEACAHAWDALKQLKQYLATHLPPSAPPQAPHAFIGKSVWIGAGTIIEPGVMIVGPAIIGRNCQIRHNAYLRENVIVGDECVVGNSSELKHSILFNKAQVPHFNYVGDSILGHRTHLGAGVKISNVKLMPENISVEMDGKWVDTGLRKFGALVGDHTEIGCNAVLNPGSIIGRNCIIYPNATWRGILPANHMVKLKASLEVVVRRPRET